MARGISKFDGQRVTQFDGQGDHQGLLARVIVKS